MATPPPGAGRDPGGGCARWWAAYDQCTRGNLQSDAGADKNWDQSAEYFDRRSRGGFYDRQYDRHDAEPYPFDQRVRGGVRCDASYFRHQVHGWKSPGNYGGGAILCGGPDNVVSITNCTFEGNVSTGRGGALSIGAVAWSLSTTAYLPIISHCYRQRQRQRRGDTDQLHKLDHHSHWQHEYYEFYLYRQLRIVYAFYLRRGNSCACGQSPQSPSFYTKIEKNKFINNNTALTTDSEGGAISILSDFAVDVNYNVFAGNTLGGLGKTGIVGAQIG